MKYLNGIDKCFSRRIFVSTFDIDAITATYAELEVFYMLIQVNIFNRSFVLNILGLAHCYDTERIVYTFFTLKIYIGL